MKSPDSSAAIALHCLDLLATVAAIIAVAVVTGSTSNLMAIEQVEPSRLKPRLCPARLPVGKRWQQKIIGLSQR
ncbi:hypothetical protein IQ254_15420 [Nodosilinea sp. LEGE 07088]|uniref:hypothetical protein n=1 Tax=Nodosilinea sp. LEGE 07088 TaxID=2777968 RepID=UPI0018823089|nr:hypothetical protein [Nodosilinea sp. LEGE 07088]MBE9138564.1 hypothetical protein [Nodosilinea sp. LEGE 07088]